MNDVEDRGGKGRRQAGEDAELFRLLREAGPRPEVPAEDLAAITAAARAEWRRHHPGGTAARPRPARGRAFAAAAAGLLLAFAFAFAFWVRESPPPAPTGPIAVATVDVVGGDVKVWEPARGALEALKPRRRVRSLEAGSRLELGAGSGDEGRLAVRLAGGASARFAAGTRARLGVGGRIDLERGAVYVDSGTGPDRQTVLVATAAGLFRDVGTQFEVRIDGDGSSTTTRLRVREGQVTLARAEAPVVAGAGEELSVRERGGEVARRNVPTYGPDWAWTLDAAPPFALEGKKVATFLAWVARETGLTVEFADPEAERVAASVDLHGAIPHLTPDQAPGVVLPTAGLGHRVEEERLVVFTED